MISASTLRMVGLAIAGVLVAIGVAVLASQLASRQIGLASEPVSAGDDLAPAIARPQRGSHGDESTSPEPEKQPETTTTTPTPPGTGGETTRGEETTSESEPSDRGEDSSSGGDGGEGGHGDD